MCTYVPKMCYFMWYGFPPAVPSTKHESSRSVTCKHGDFARLRRGFRATSLKSWDLFLMIPMNESAFILTRKWDLWGITRLLPSAYFNYKTGETHGHLPESLAVSGIPTTLLSSTPTEYYDRIAVCMKQEARNTRMTNYFRRDSAEWSHWTLRCPKSQQEWCWKAV